MPTQSRYGFLPLSAAFLAAIATVLTEVVIQFFGVVPLLTIVLGNLFGGVVLLLASVSNFAEMRALRWWRVAAPIVAASLAIYTLGFLAGFNAISLIGAGKVALLGQLETIFVVILAIIFLGEYLTPRRILAGLIAVGGAVLINFDFRALRLSFGLGELLAVLAPLGLASGIIMLKPVLDKWDARWITGLAMLLGAAFLSPAIGFIDKPVDINGTALLALLVMGVTRGGAWLTYNMGLRHIGASRSAVIFLSFAFFTVLLQIIAGWFWPKLGLQIPGNLFSALLGGILVAAGIIVLLREQGPGPEQPVTVTL